MAYSVEKMRHAILFFLERGNNVHLGRTKLMKLLYYVDFEHYEKHGRPITGATYRKFPHGPAPQEAGSLISQMVKKGLLREFKVKRGNYPQDRLATQNIVFDSAVFSGAELETLEGVVREWGDATAAEIEAASHAEALWTATSDGDQTLAKSKKFAKYVMTFSYVRERPPHTPRKALKRFRVCGSFTIPRPLFTCLYLGKRRQVQNSERPSQEPGKTWARTKGNQSL